MSMIITYKLYPYKLVSRIEDKKTANTDNLLVFYHIIKSITYY